VLGLRGLVAELYGLPVGLVTFLGAANVAYASLGLTLAARSRRPLALVVTLAAANAAWTLVCASLLLRFAGEAGPLGLAHLVLEGAFTAGLATVEWRNRHALSAPPALGCGTRS
jgi:hypothetical protein